MNLAITSATLEPPEFATNRIGQVHLDWLTTHIARAANQQDIEWLVRHNTPDDNLGVTGSLQWCYERTTAPVIAFLHSDTEIFEQGWDSRVLKEFDDPAVGVVGFGGAVQLGEDDIYKKPYEMHQLRRIGYMSNTNDAETHGSRFEGECDVATLDGFALIVRRELLDRWAIIGHGSRFASTQLFGWPVQQMPFHNYDNALCIEAARQKYRVRLVGVRCHHHGGRTTVTTAYDEWSRRVLGKPDSEVHADSHRVLYEMGRGILPIRVR
jgi:hypothetical protein